MRKTTLTRLINGLIPHYYEGCLTGEILLDGVELVSQPMYETAKKVGSVFQNPRTQFYNVDSTSEIVFGCENIGLPIDEIYCRLNQAKADLKLDGLLDRSLFALSGGEKQKIACASVYTAYPEVIVLDEPSSNLDIKSIKDLAHVISLWKQYGKTIIAAEHRLYYLVPFADRVLYMNHGRIEREFSGKEFKELSPEELIAMGLRSLHPFDLRPKAEPRGESHGKIIFKDFKFSYKKSSQTVLEIPSLTLPENEVIGIIGNNGAGKSTFARCLCGLDLSASGILEMADHCYTVKQRSKLSYMVMQDVNHQLFTESVLDEIRLSMDGEDEQREEQEAEDILRSLDLTEKRELHPMSLSGGEKQRVAIGSSIASSKQILVFDEPTSGLDYRHMLETAENLKKLYQMGKSLFIITHDPELICKSCTHILFIEDGKVLWNRDMDEKTIGLLHDFFTGEAAAQ